MRVTLRMVLLVLIPSAVFAQDAQQGSASTTSVQPVPGTLSPSQQQQINQALPPLDPPKLRPPAPPRIQKEDETKKKETPLEWTLRTITEVTVAANKLYAESDSYAGNLSASALEKEIDSLDAPWGGSLTLLRVMPTQYTVSLPNVPPSLCQQIFDSIYGKDEYKGISFLNSCSAVQPTPLLYIYKRQPPAKSEDQAGTP